MFAGSAGGPSSVLRCYKVVCLALTLRNINAALRIYSFFMSQQILQVSDCKNLSTYIYFEILSHQTFYPKVFHSKMQFITAAILFNVYMLKIQDNNYVDNLN